MAPLRGWDEGFYLGQLTSVISDRDLLLQNDLLLLDNPFPDKFRALTDFGPTGSLDNTFGIGPALIQSVYAWPVLIRSRGTLPPGLRILLSLGSLALLALYALATMRVLGRFGFGLGLSLAATATGILSGPLALYGTRFAFSSHLPAAACAALMLLACLLWQESPDILRGSFLGLSAGLLVIVRWQDVALLLPVLLGALAVARRQGWGPLLPVVGAGAATVLVQCAAWRVQFGEWVLVPQGPGYLGQAHLLPLLVSTYHGLVPWAPGLALGVAGLPLLLRGQGGFRKVFLLGVLGSCLLSVLVSALPQDWWGGASYGPRRVASIAPMATLGLAAILRALRPLLRTTLLVALGCWGVVCASASLSGVDDIAVLFTGHGGPLRPHPSPVHETVRWHDGWKGALYLKPGFTLTDTPRNGDRLLGLLVVAVVLGVTLGLFHLVSRSPFLQRCGLVLALCWVLAWISLLCSVIPSEQRANRAWVQVVCGKAEALAGLPPSVRGAGHLVLATYAAAAGDPEGLDAHLRLVRRPPVSAEDLALFGQSAEGRTLVREAQERGCEAAGLGRAETQP
jgi:hypothetical protein